MYIYKYIYTYIYIYMYICVYIYIRIMDIVDSLAGAASVHEQAVGQCWLFIVGLFCCIYIFYYLYVDSLTYAFGMSAFLRWIIFCDILVVIFLSKHYHH
jgi:hypothetical protein